MIPPNVFGKGLMIQYLQNIVISSNCLVGDYCCLFHGATLGIKVGNNDQGEYLRIADGVTICTGQEFLGMFIL